MMTGVTHGKSPHRPPDDLDVSLASMASCDGEEVEDAMEAVDGAWARWKRGGVRRGELFGPQVA